MVEAVQPTPQRRRRISSRRKRRQQTVKILAAIFGGAVLFTLIAVFFVIRPLAKHSVAATQPAAVRTAPIRPGRDIPAGVIEQLNARALQGDARAQNDLGVLHQLGKAVPQDDLEAVRWYRRAAERNSVLAQNNLGWMYERGRGLERDYAGALFWYKLAAQAGNVAAQHNLASLYERGLGIPPNPMLATEWYERAIKQGDETAREGLTRVTGPTTGAKVTVDEKLAQTRAALASPGFLERLGLRTTAQR